MEILAPAGSPEALKAALEAGADAVYFGLKNLNARRGAGNFTPEEAGKAVSLVHKYKAGAYLTLNVDLTQRELGEAARRLEFSRLSGFDAIIVKDPALLKLRMFFPEVRFHLSTQAGISSGAGIMAAKELGIQRVILPRELSFLEIKAASSFSGIETEVFVQGAMCFSVSGRCLASSWAGGRSGNRGLCASPCRVLWFLENLEKSGRFFSMHDLSLAEKVARLKECGVKALKIEGRLKKAGWVAGAVRIYRQILGGVSPASLRKEVEKLGDYTGRKLTSGYFDGCRSNLTGESGRIAHPSAEIFAGNDSPQNENNCRTCSIEVVRDGSGIIWTFSSDGVGEELRIPLSEIHEEKRAVTLRNAGEILMKSGISGCRVAEFRASDPKLLITRNSFNKVRGKISAFLHRIAKIPKSSISISLPAAVKTALEGGMSSSLNKRKLGEKPDRIRIDAASFCEFRGIFPEEKLILENADANALIEILSGCDRKSLPVVSLPFVFYEADTSKIGSLISVCKSAGAAVEVNSWDGWFLAKEEKVEMEAGPGMMILNSFAAEFLYEKGCRCATVSLEAGRTQIEDLCAKCPVPLSLYVYGRPPLMITRAKSDEELIGPDTVIKDTRNLAVKSFRNGELTVFRPVEPFNLSGIHNEKIFAAHMVADLVGAENPVGEWRKLLKNSSSRNHFNFDRKLA